MTEVDLLQRKQYQILLKKQKNEFEQYAVDISSEDVTEVKSLINKMSAEILSGEFLDKGCNKKDCEYCSFSSS